ncbi:MAG: histidine--tRNA ligase [Acidobacteria bacterium]|nr:histidine--tRNA ligase [Acidobacteriota bacterium]
MISAIRGTRDILPGEVGRWQRIERVAHDLCARYGYAEVRTPVIEREELFAKGTGESTDIVQKEMYAFTDKGGERITLRPEATPSMVRAFVEHALEQDLPCAKLYSLGPMFRYERPQKGRYRQFHQLDVEVFGIADPAVDAEVIEMACALLSDLGIDAELVINSVGCDACRPRFSEALIAALGERVGELCGDCQRRATTNPLRIFDCKVPADQPIIDGLPHSDDFLCDACRDHFAGVKSQLDAYAIPYRVSHRLVRGLDYYTRTTFEMLGTGLGAQNALLGGGRYDHLVKRLGGPDRPGIGFAAGLERLVLALPEAVGEAEPADAFVVAFGEAAWPAARLLTRDLRRAGLATLIDYEGRSAKSQMKRANRSGVRHMLILGDDELASNQVTVKTMETGHQQSVSREALADHLRAAETGLNRV